MCITKRTRTPPTKKTPILEQGKDEMNVDYLAVPESIKAKKIMETCQKDTVDGLEWAPTNQIWEF